MSDKELIETLKKIHLHCCERYCNRCKFNLLKSNINRDCQIIKLTRLLTVPPYLWDIEEIEEVICK